MATGARSAFVTATGWIFAVLSAGYVLLALMQNLLFARVDLDALSPSDAARLPPVLLWLYAHLHELLLANLVVAVLSLIASVALLARRNWGRLLFVAMLVVGVAWNVAAIWLQFAFASAVEAEVARAGAQGEPGFATFMFVMKAMVLFFCSLFGAIFGWIAWRLMQPDVDAEFGAS